MSMIAGLPYQHEHGERLKKFSFRDLPRSGILLGLIGGGFLAIIAFIAIVAVVDPPNPQNAKPATLFQVIPALLCVSTFCFAGGVILLLAFRSWNDASERGQLQRRHPDQPWRWRLDWQEGWVTDTGTLLAVFYLVVSLLACGISWTAVFAVLMQERVPLGDHSNMGTAILVMMFCLGTTGFLAYSLYRYVCERRSGQSQLHLITLPIQPATALVGRVRLSRPIEPGTRVRINLECSKNKHHQELATRVFKDLHFTYVAGSTENAREIPIVCEIPADAPVTNPNEGTEWSLTVTFRDEIGTCRRSFEVPVFKVDDADAATHVSVAPEQRSLFDSLIDERSRIQPESFSDMILRCGGEVEVDTDTQVVFWTPFHREQLRMQLLLAPLLTLGFAGAALVFDDQFGIAVSLLAKTAFLVSCLGCYQVIKTALFRQRIEVDAKSLRFSKMTLVGERTEMLDARDIDDLRSHQPKARTQLGTGEEHVVAVKTNQGKNITILSGLPDRGASSMIERRIRQHLDGESVGR